jgi:hypothetical protein
MTSEAKAAANRRNAKRSTGPRTAAGKARASRNAFRHGMSIPMSTDLMNVLEVSEYFRLLMSDFDGADREQAVRAAEGQAELLRVRRIKTELINREAMRCRERDTSSSIEECVATAFDCKAKILESLDRYERRALSKRRRSLRKLNVASQRGQKGNPGAL